MHRDSLDPLTAGVESLIDEVLASLKKLVDKNLIPYSVRAILRIVVLTSQASNRKQLLSARYRDQQ